MYNPIKKIRDLENRIKILETLLEDGFIDTNEGESIGAYIKRTLEKKLSSEIETILLKYFDKFTRDELEYITILDRLTQLEQHNYNRKAKVREWKV